MQRNRRLWGLGTALTLAAGLMFLTTLASPAGAQAQNVRWDIISTTGVPPTPINPGGHASATAPTGIRSRSRGPDILSRPRTAEARRR